MGNCLMKMTFDIHRENQVDSTNVRLKEMAKKGELTPGYVLCADRQSAGRARSKEKCWVSEQGGLYASIFFDQVDPLLPLRAALAIVYGLQELGLKAGAKWPNDILVGEKKICGILCESAVDAQKKPFAIAGFGVNVENGQFAPQLSEKATSVALELERPVSRRQTLLAVLEGWNRALETPDIIGAYKNCCLTLGAKVRVMPQGKVVRALDVDEHGCLVVEDGGRKTIVSGEVSIRGEKGYI